MCGIAGKVYLDGDRAASQQLVQAMIDIIAHRGPDGQGTYVDGPASLGHRRLSIIDLRPTGAQPMCNEDRTVWITFNGEIYNYQSLREQLISQGHVFRSESDTETIVHLWEQHGVDCVQHLRGMFAFAIWDTRQRALFVARDRVGIKPLYYCRTPKALMFASELKALLVDPEVPRRMDPEVIDRFLTYFYVPGSDTLFADIKKLDPGHYLLAKDGRVITKQYWDLEYKRGEWKSIDEASEALSALLRQTVADHMISDVPVGFLASGGVDSTALLSYAVEQTATPIQTFTVGFDDPRVVDERPYARLASKTFGTVHHEITVSANDFGEFLPSYVWHMEEPVCEPPAIALYYVSKLARDHVKVLLSGEGGDEAFGGYPEYKNYLAFEQMKRWCGPFRRPAGAVLDAVGRAAGSDRLDKYRAFVNRELPEYFYSRVSSPETYFNRTKATLYAPDFRAALRAGHSAQTTLDLFDRAPTGHLLNRMLYVDTKSWLPDDLLVKADKMTMATSLELRVPFLDHKVLEFAASLPPDYKVKGRQSKRVLKKTFAGRVPEKILTRRKAGFPVPYGRWLANDLRELVNDTVLSSRAVGRGYFRRAAIADVVQRGTAAGGASTELFALLVLELWHQRFADASQPAVEPVKGVAVA
jgi:asparagine synthase (glutamine-hydrolysing)